jgi:hypothetical protein
MEENPMHLRAAAVVNEEKIVISYSISHAGDTPAYVMTLVTDAGLTPLPHKAHVAFLEIEQAVHVFLGQAPLPAGIEVLVKALPLSRLLKRGDTFKDYIDISIPIMEWQPYAHDKYPSDCIDRLVNRLVLSTEFIFPENAFFARKIDKPQGYFRVNGYPVGKLSTTIQLDHPVRVLQRTDDFVRF